MLIHIMISTTVAPILAAPQGVPTSQPAMTMMPLSMNMVLEIFVSHSFFARCSLLLLDLDIKFTNILLGISFKVTFGSPNTGT
jgi:hypothetical protein